MTKRPASSSSRGRSRLRIVVNGCPAALATTLRRAARHTLHAEELKSGQLEIVVVSAARMRREHARWLNDGSDTDVLTFDLRDQPASGRVEGVIIVCRETARQAAATRGTTAARELTLYVVHGCLHLAGYRDKARADFNRMHRREDELLTALGIGPVFADHPAASSRRLTSPRRRR